MIRGELCRRRGDLQGVLLRIVPRESEILCLFDPAFPGVGAFLHTVHKEQAENVRLAVVFDLHAVAVVVGSFDELAALQFDPGRIIGRGRLDEEKRQHRKPSVPFPFRHGEIPARFPRKGEDILRHPGQGGMS